MGDWAPAAGVRVESIGALASTSAGTDIAASGTANTKGSYVTLISSTAFHSDRLVIVMGSASLTTYLVDIAVGAAASEQVLIPNIHYSGSNLFPYVMDFPVGVPAGSRVSCRCASATASAAVSISAYAIAGGWSAPPGLSRVITYGALTASSKGTEIDPGGTVNTKGAWVELVAPFTPTPALKGLILGLGNNNNVAASAGSWLIDVGVGTAGFEQVAIPNYRMSMSTAETITPPCTPFIPVSIPAGSRLAVRAQSNLSVDATDRKFSAVLHGVS